MKRFIFLSILMLVWQVMTAQCTAPVVTASGPTTFCPGGSVTLSTPAVGNTWTQKADLNGVGRIFATGFSIGSKGYIGTGFNFSTNYLKDFWEYDPATNAWTQKADFGGEAREGATGFSIGNRGYIGTGYNTVNTFNNYFNDFWEYDPSTNVWTRKANFGGGVRHYATGFSIGSKGYIGTGRNGSNYYKDFWEYEPSTNAWAQKSDFGGEAREGATGFSISSKGYIGTGQGSSNYYKDFWEYEPSTNVWRQRADISGAARGYATGFSIGSKGYIGTGGSAKDFWEYNSLTNVWVQKADVGGTGRYGAIGFSIGSKGYIGTGGSGYKRDFWEYTPDLTYTWSPGGQTTSSITVSASGSYTVMATNEFGCSATSAATTVTVNPTVTPSVSILASSTNICSGTSVTFTATPTNGGSAPAYQWQKNGAAISGATNASYTTATLANNDVISVILTSNAVCATPASVTSNSITITVYENTGGVVYVDSSRASSGSGASWATAYKELREALNAARQCSNITSILVAKGTYKPTGNTDRDSAFTILRGGLKIYGGYNASTGIRNITGNPTILSGNINTAAANDNSYHVVVIVGLGSSADSLVLDGIIVSGGYANGGATKLYNGETFYQTEGAGICISNSNGSGGKIALRNCSFIADTASANGGAIYNRASSPTITNCGFTSNYAGGGGGGIFNNSYASPAISRCTFNASRAGKGGGIYNYSYSSPVVSNTIFTGNTTVGRGGAVYSEDNSSPSFNSDVFNANNAGDGGAIAAYFYAPSTFANCVFVQNNAGSDGGAIAAINNCPTTITNCTFTANNATYGGGMNNYLSSNATISNSIFWGNTGTYPLFDNSNSTVLISNSIVQGGYGGAGNYNADPLFVNTADPNGADNIFGTADDGLKLQAGSPAVNTGSNSAASAITTDVTGATRIQNGTVDMGAYEGFVCPATGIVYVDNGIASPGNGSSWATAYKELNTALAAAQQCSSITTIQVAKGTYKPIDYANQDSAFTVYRGGLKIYGGYPSGGGVRNAGANPTILSGEIGTSAAADNSYHIMVIAGLNNTADSVVLDGFTLTGGYAKGTGSALYNGISIDRNHGAAIAAEQNAGGKLALRNLIFANNAGGDGWGAALVLNAYNAFLDKCIFYGNSTSGTGQGGAIWNNNSTTVMSNCLLYNNYGAGLGGAIQLNGSNPLSVINSTFYNNRTGGNGGAIRSGAGSVLNLSNTIFYKNDIGTQNGAYAAPGNDLTLVGTYTITNCMLQGSASSYSGAVSSVFGSDPLFANETSPAGADNIPGTADDGLRLQAGSPAINAGSNAAAAGIASDITGAARIQNGTVDMGAYESAFTPLITYYPRTTATDLSQVSNWTTDMAGGTGGSQPSNFTSPNQLFNVNGNVAKPQVLGAWTISGGSGLVLYNTDSLIFRPTASLTIGTGSSADFNGRPVTLKSTASGTAFIGQISGSLTNASNVTVERYLSSSGNRAYRLLTPSVNTTTSIHANWQEGATSRTDNPRPRYGTHITGDKVDQTGGFDATATGEGSLFTVSSTAGYQYIPNTNATTLSAKSGYLIYIRGDRSIDLASNATPLPSTNTTLRATGTLLTGTQTFTGTVANTGSGTGFNLVTNPYASPINWQSVYGANTGLTQFYTLFDPNVGGDRGGYVTVNTIGIKSNPASNATAAIQSGQAFFVQASGAAIPTVTIQEAHKSTVNNVDVFRTGAQTELFTSSLFYTNAQGVRVNADGVTSVYNNAYDTAVDGNDAEQIANFDEDVAIRRSGHDLSIESRPLIDLKDTIPFAVARLQTARPYEWQFNASNFNAPGLTAYLLDRFLNTQTPVSLSGTTVVAFTVTSNPASSAANRFAVVFVQGVNTPLPISGLTVKAHQKDKNVEVEWTAQTEVNLDRYEVEKSTDARQFTKATSVTAGNAGGAAAYNWIDGNAAPGANYYRIKALGTSGETKYSNVVRVDIGKATYGIAVYPNPVTDGAVSLNMNLPKGAYTVTLTNALGQRVYKSELTHPGGSATQSLPLSAGLAQGVYRLSVSDGGENRYVQQLIKQ